jgi:hypothetical protein
MTNSVATTGDNNALFFFKIEAELVPIGFVSVNGRKPRTKEEITQTAISGVPLVDDQDYARGLKIRWNGNIVSVNCSDGTVASVMAPTGLADPSSESFYINVSMEVIQGVPPEEGVTARLPFGGLDLEGMKDGTIICEKFCRQIHSAAITTMATTSHNNWLLTASENGEIFLFEQEDPPHGRLDIVEPQTVDLPAVREIKPGDYSIKEEKQKSELGHRIKAADEKKELIKQRIESLRQGYIALVHDNAKVPAYRVFHIRCSTPCHERGCAACPRHRQGNSKKVGYNQNPINCSEPFPCLLFEKNDVKLGRLGSVA